LRLRLVRSLSEEEATGCFFFSAGKSILPTTVGPDKVLAFALTTSLEALSA
jgi:hypothetical protein